MSDGFMPLPPPPPQAGGGDGNGGGRGRCSGRGRGGGGGRWQGGGNNSNRRGGGRGGYGGGRGRGGRGRGRGGGGRGRSGRGGRPGSGDGDVKGDAAAIEEVGLPSPPPPPPTDPAAAERSTVTGDAPRRKRTHLRIAVQGCAHGSLDRIYATLQARDGPPVDLLLCCGDFQAVRNCADLQTLAVPPKYRELGTFWRYYAGEVRAPIPTIFIGGNHEASGYLQELFYGGWVAPNIYYLGAAGVVQFGGVRIGGIGGIYKSHDFRKGRYESPPYDAGTLRSVYHVRNVEVYRMKCLGSGERVVDVVLSHDWPRGIERHGDTNALLRKKSFFRREVEQNDLGSPANEDILHAIRPRWWFSAHLHVKFTATVRHDVNGDAEGTSSSSGRLVPSQVRGRPKTGDADPVDADTNADTDGTATSFHGLESSAPCPAEGSVPDLTDQMTRFLSLDKCLPRRQHLQIINIPIPACNDGEADVKDDDAEARPPRLVYDLEWLAVLRRTHGLTQNTRSYVSVPDEPISVTEEEMEEVRSRLVDRRRRRQGPATDESNGAGGDGEGGGNASPLSAIPDNFCVTVPPHGSPGSDVPANGGAMVGNPQTDELLDMLGLDHVVTVPYRGIGGAIPPPPPPPPPRTLQVLHDDENEIDLDDDIAEEGDGDETAGTSRGGRADENEIYLEDSDDGDVDAEEHATSASGEVASSQAKKARTGSL